MTQRIVLGANDIPLKVFDASGNSNLLDLFFSSNHQPIRHSAMRGTALITTDAGSISIAFPTAFSSPPFFFAMCNDPVAFNGVFHNFAQPGSWGHGFWAQSFTDHLQVQTEFAAGTTGAPQTVYYGILWNKPF